MRIANELLSHKTDCYLETDLSRPKVEPVTAIMPQMYRAQWLFRCDVERVRFSGKTFVSVIFPVQRNLWLLDLQWFWCNNNTSRSRSFFLIDGKSSWRWVYDFFMNCVLFQLFSGFHALLECCIWERLVTILSKFLSLWLFVEDLRNCHTFL